MVTGKTQSLATWPLHGLALQHCEQFKREPRIDVIIRPQERAPQPEPASRGYDLGRPYTWFNAPLYHLEILNKVQTKGSTFSFCTESYTLCKCVLLPRSHVFAKCHSSQISATFHQVRTPTLRAIMFSLRNFNKSQKLGIEIKSKNGRTLRESPAKAASEVTKATSGLP